MDSFIDKINKLSLPAVILIASIILGGFYFASQAMKQGSIEKQQQIKIEQEKQVQLDKEAKEQQAKEEAEQALNACRADAQKIYSNRWHEECKAQGKLTNKCIDIKELDYVDYLEKYGLTSEEYEKQRGIADDSLLGGFLDYYERRDNDCSCRLSLASYADRFNEKLADDKAECLKRYPQ